ncbi:MAG TPA: capsule assembly Wzi family protein, partial [Longimicrobiaceae bacterium]|nr:capsule assembly Wzi family protein [Longimicrobiaceae bacterium]
YGNNDGPVWAGRGITTSLRAAVAYRSRHLWATLAPVAFVSQNAAYATRPTGFPGLLSYADERFPRNIDLPQRFGRGAYGRFDPGESSLGVAAGPVTFGASTASQVWGPAVEYPLLLGNNAGGFAHVFLGTSRPLDAWIGKVHGRVVWGRLAQSPFSSVAADSGARFATGVVGTFQPRGVPGLELGVARFFHARWPDGLGDAPLGLAFEGVLKSSLSGSAGQAGGSDQTNQLASAFFRWAAPGDGFEVWGEFAREDHSYDLRDFVLEPDHSAAVLLGFRKVWARGPGLVSLRAEVADARTPHLLLVRGEGPFYQHYERRQGHTQRGQLLGSPAVYGGGGSTVAVDAYSAGGVWSAAWKRELLGENVSAGYVETFGARNTLSLSRSLFTRGVKLTGGIDTSLDLGANGRGDRLNVSTVLQVDLP